MVVCSKRKRERLGVSHRRVKGGEKSMLHKLLQAIKKLFRGIILSYVYGKSEFHYKDGVSSNKIDWKDVLSYA